jgi:excisionase family DNA binding protein
MTTAVIEPKAPQTTEPLLLRPIEAARALGIGARSLWRLTDAGEVPCVRIGRSVRYAPADLQAYIDKRRAQN